MSSSAKETKPAKKPQNSKQKEAEEEAARAEEERLRQTALISSTFANMELQTTKLTLAQYTELYTKAKEDVTKLQRELADREREHAQGMRHQQEKLDKALTKVKQMDIACTERVEQTKRDVAEEHDKLRTTIKELQGTIEALRETSDQQLADLDALNAFKRERHDIHRELANYKQRQAEVGIAHEEQISALKFSALEERVRLKAEEKALKERFDEEVQRKAEGMLDARTSEIHEDNKLVVSEKQTLQMELARIAKENQRLTTINSDQRRELSLLKGAEEEFSKRCGKQLHEIKGLKDLITALEANAERTNSKYEKKLRDLQLATSNRVTVLESERDNAVRNAEGRHRELGKMRSLAKTVVRQRTELETFFSEAFDFVRRELAKERQQQQILVSGPSQVEAQQQQRLSIEDTTVNGSSTHKRMITMRHGNNTAVAPPRALENHPIYATLTPRGTTRTAQPPKRAMPNTSTSLVIHPSQASKDASSVPSLPAIRTTTRRTPSSAPTPSETTPTKAKGIYHSAADETTTNPNMASGGADISDLSWSDKERVLRILFAKINGKDQQAATLEQNAHDNSVGKALTANTTASDTKLLGDKEGTTFFTQNM